MLKSLILVLAIAPLAVFADTADDSAEEIERIEDALDSLVQPARVEVGVGVGDGYDRPGRPRAQYTCYVRDAWGRTYDSTGFVPNRVERRALQQCRSYSGYSCRSMGCRRVR